MVEDDFEQQIKQGLEKLTREQRIHFAWRCAVRVLPFLGGGGSFGFWNIEKRQKHIYSVFYAIDSAYATTTTTAASAYVDAAYVEAVADAVAAVDAVAYTYAYSDAAAIAIAATATANAATANAATASNAVATRHNINLKPLILQDIKTSQEEALINPIDFYNEIWINFQQALEAEGCSYWGKLYQTIFENGFQIDRQALIKRLSVPKEIRQQGAKVVANYLQEMETKGDTQLNEARIIILGDKGAGKTCIARRLVDPDALMTTDEESTAGVDTTLWQPDNEQINIRIWDFAGHTVTHAVHQFFLSERCLYLMVYNARTEEKNRLEYWLNHMENYGGNSKAIILVNERDQHRADIKINFLKEKYPIAEVYYFSVKNDADKLTTFRADIIQYIVNNPSWENQAIPISYYQVKEELELVFSKNEQHTEKEHITRKTFDKIADKYEVEDKEHLLQSLHCLGVSLWYKEMAEFDTLVLNPEWISHGVYKIINWVHEAKKYALALGDFITVFEDDAERYPIDKHVFLFKLMKHYELAYETEANGNLIIPHLLDEDRPEILPEFSEDDLKLKYEANQPLPPNTISRFIVRHNQQIKKQQQESLVWRYGVILENSKGSLALVREDDRIISISVTGQDKTNYIAELRASLNDIFDSYKSDKPELQYKVISDVDISVGVNTKNSELWLPEQRVLNLFKAGVPHFEDASGKNITMNLTIHNYHMQDNSRVLQAEHIDNSINNTFNFYDCNISLQGDLNHLAQLLTETGKKEEAKALENTANALEQLEQCESKDEVKKKGLASRLQQLTEDLGDKKSKLRKAVDGVEKGVKISQDIAKRYNAIAEWLGLPQVPKPLL